MKKVLALVLAAMMVLAIAPMSFAATSIAPVGYSSNIKESYGAFATGGDTVITTRGESPTLKYYLTSDAAGTLIPKTNAKDIDVKVRYSEGAKAVRDVSIQYGKDLNATGDNTEYAYVRVRFLNKFVSTGSQDYNITFYLTYKKAKVAGSDTELVGTLKNVDAQPVYEDYDYMYLYDAPVVEAKEYVKLTELELGEGVSIFAKLFEGKKYYGYATQKVLAEDDEVVSKYPAIGSIYYLDTIGLNSTGNYVKLDISDKLFVYNADLEYIGTTNDKLPYSTKYYVADAELDIETDDVDEGPAEGGETSETPENPDMGGDDVPTNVNDNPGTGC